MRHIIVIVTACLVLSGCGAYDWADNVGGDEITAPAQLQPDPDAPVDSGSSGPIAEPGIPGSIPEPPTPVDGSIDGDVTIDTTDLRVMESFPIQIAIDVSGEKPSPCHNVFWSVDDDGQVIVIEMTSQIAPSEQCIDVIEQFTIVIPLGSWLNESREVILNGEVVGSFKS